MKRLAHHPSLAVALGLVAAVGMHAEARAEDKPDFVDAAIVCTDGLANKDRLADQLLAKYPISLQALTRALPAGQTSRRQALASLLKNPEACADQCQAGDSSNARKIGVALINLQRGDYAPEFALQDKSDASTLLDDTGTAIQCVPQARKPSPKDTGLAALLKERLRIRGKENDLSIPRGEPTLSSADQASLTIAMDHEQKKRTHDSHGYIGFNILPEAKDGRRTDLIAYAGGKRSSVRTKGVDDRTNEQRSVNYGLMLALFRPGIASDDALNARLDFLVDHVDGSHIGSLRIEYTPYKPDPGALGINTFERLNLPLLPKTFAKLIFSVPFDYGQYVRRAAGATKESQPDFGHAGVRLGLGLALDGASLPLEFNTTYTALRAWHGHVDVNYLKSGLTLNLTEKKYLGLELSYSRGRLEDTFKNEKKWSIALKGRY